MERTIVTYPFVAGSAEVPGRCRHVVARQGEGLGVCCRPATHAVGGVGLCRAHLAQYRFWQRGGRVGTPAELFEHLAAVGTVIPFIDGRSGRPTGEAVRVPAGWSLSVRRGARVGYAGLARHRAEGGGWRYRLEYPLSGPRRRAAFRKVAADTPLLLDLEDNYHGD